jgi:hypothetical protein
MDDWNQFVADYAASLDAKARSDRAHRSPGHPLVGRWAHCWSADGQTILWQGRVLAQASRDHFLVARFSWVGAQVVEELVLFTAMQRWTFYASRAAMDRAFAAYDRRRQQEASGEPPRTTRCPEAPSGLADREEP